MRSDPSVHPSGCSRLVWGAAAAAVHVHDENIWLLFVYLHPGLITIHGGTCRWTFTSLLPSLMVNALRMSDDDALESIAGWIGTGRDEE